VLLSAYALSIWGVARFSQTHPSSIGLWPCSGFLAAALFILKGKARWGVAAACFIFRAGLMVLSGKNAQDALPYAVWDAAEAIGSCLMLPVALGPRGLLRSPAGFIRLQLLAVVCVCVAASAGFAITTMLIHPGLNWNPQRSLLSHMLGMAVVVPAMLLMLQPPLPAQHRSWRETWVVLGGVAVVLALMFRQAGPPAVIIGPTLIFATLRLGPRGAAMSAMMASLLGMPIVATGGGPFSLHPEWTYDQRVVLFQLTVVSLLLGVTLMGFALAQQSRLTQLLAQRAQSARAARRRAARASQAKTEFLATMSHEVRTPMNSILGFTTVLARDASLSPDVRGKVEMIAKAGESLMALLNDILDFSKVEAGQVELENERVNILAACREVVQIVGPTAEAKGLLIDFAAASEAEGFFLTDALRLRQILLNLLNNAVKFTSEGKVGLSVRMVEAGDGPVRARFEVTDTGIGIDPAAESRLFLRFSQADGTIARTFGGTGLGLAICKGLVDRMGGHIGVDSRPDMGSVFWFELPLERVDTEDNDSRADAAAERRPLNARVLLVDDHPVNRQLGQALLEMLGCRVELAEDGEQAVQAAARGGYDVILMDVHMPRMDGLTATRAIRQLPSLKGSVPIVALSADVLPHNIAQCMKAGMVDHVPKPVQLDVLYTVLRRCLREQAAIASVSAA
jgi:signal transduction histidine kinase/CheY-like chemotaxis protein